MTWSDYETLQWLGNLDLQFTWNVSLVKFKYPGSYREPAINVGHSDGDWGMKLVFSVLSKSLAPGIDPGAQFGGLQSRADYLWEFYRRHKLGGDKPFIVECEFPGSKGLRQFLMVFAEDNISYQAFAVRLFSSGLALEQARVRGFVGEDQISGGNPIEI